MSEESFLSRWSRRKQSAPEEVRAEDQRVAREQPAATVDQAAATPANPPAGAVAEPPPELPPLESLNPQSDFTPFMQARVPPQLKNAALKKLFADPHFNLMDGLDTYIDDYTRSEPIPLEMMRKLAQSRALKLFDYSAEEAAEKLALEEEQARRAGAEVPQPAAIPASTPAAAPESSPPVASLDPEAVPDTPDPAAPPAGPGADGALR